MWLDYFWVKSVKCWDGKPTQSLTKHIQINTFIHIKNNHLRIFSCLQRPTVLKCWCHGPKIYPCLSKEASGCNWILSRQFSQCSVVVWDKREAVICVKTYVIRMLLYKEILGFRKTWTSRLYNHNQLLCPSLPSPPGILFFQNFSIADIWTKQAVQWILWIFWIISRSGYWERNFSKAELSWIREGLVNLARHVSKCKYAHGSGDGSLLQWPQVQYILKNKKIKWHLISIVPVDVIAWNLFKSHCTELRCRKLISLNFPSFESCYTGFDASQRNA